MWKHENIDCTQENNAIKKNGDKIEELKTIINNLEAIKADVFKQRFLNKENDELLFKATCFIRKAIEKLVLANYYTEKI